MEDLFMRQLHCFGATERDPGGRVVSVAYWSLVKIDQNNIKLSMADHDAQWVDFRHVPELILDHGDMVQMAIQQLRKEALFYPVGFELLPKEFTLRQLLNVYEAIFDVHIDDRNFRKKILRSGLLTDLQKKDKSTSKKGSFLYCFNQDRYQQLLEEGFHFDFGFGTS